MRTLKTILIGVIVSVFLAGQVYGAPKGNNGNGNNGQANNGKNNNSNSNNTQSNVIRTINSRSSSAQVKRIDSKSSRSRGKSALHKRNARRSSEANRRRDERNRNSQKNLSPDGHITNVLNYNSDFQDKNQNNNKNGDRAGELLNSLEQARRIQYTRESSVNGKPSQKSHSNGKSHFKKVDLKRIAQLNFQIEDSLVSLYQKTLDYYQSIVESGALMPEQVGYYRDRVLAYTRNIDRKRSKEYITVGLVGDNSVGYSLDLKENEKFKNRSLFLETSLIVQVNFVSYEYTWNEQTHTWYIEGTRYLSGDKIIIQSEEVDLSVKDKSYEFSFDPDVDFIKGISGGFFDMTTTITDKETNSQVKFVSDKALYIYRDPYGNVEDSVTGQAIVGAEITVYNLDGSIVILDKAANPNAYNPQITDATGRFAYNLRTDRKYYMVVSAPGYEEYRSGVFTEKWHVIREDIRLTPIAQEVVYRHE